MLKGNPVDLKNYQVMWKNLDTTLRKFTFTEKAIVATEFITVLERVFNTPIRSLTQTDVHMRVRVLIYNHTHFYVHPVLLCYLPQNRKFM